jgi:hypothetical protein
MLVVILDIAAASTTPPPMRRRQVMKTAPARAAVGHRVSHRVLDPRCGPHSPYRSSADLRLANRLPQIAADDP